MYSGCNWKNLVAILLAATLAACSSVGIKTSHNFCGRNIDRVRLMFGEGPQNFPSLARPAFWSVMTSETIRGSIFFNISGMGKILFPTKNSVYLLTLSLS